MIPIMKKIIVIGCPGSGKSTFSRELNKITDIPLFHLDMMYWNPDKSKVDKAIFLERLSDAMALEEWIIDGNYGSTMEMRMAACDTVIFLDYTPDVCLDGVVKRRGKPRSDMPWTETEDDEEFMEFIRNFNAESRPKIIELIGEYKDKKVYIFTDRFEADEFLRNIRYQRGTAL